MYKNLVVVEGRKAFTTTRIIAEGFEIDHVAVMKLVRKYEKDISEAGETYGFKIRKFKTAGRPGEEAILDEPQTTFLVTLMRNSKKVVHFKKMLSKAFTEQRNIISEMVAMANNPSWQNVRRDGKEIYHQKTEVIKEFVEYATARGSKNSRMYYANLAKMENSALFFFEQRYKNLREVLTIKQLMQVATADDVIEKALKEGMEKDLPYKDCYKLAKERVVAFADIIGKSPVIGFETKNKIEG